MIKIFVSHDEQQRAVDTAQPYKQESNFFYLTGITEPGWRLVVLSSFEAGDGSPTDEKILIAPDISETRRIFEGGLSAEEAISVSGASKVLGAAEGEEFINKLAAENDEVFALGPDQHEKYYDFALNEAPLRLWRELESKFKKVSDCRPELAKLRAIKSSEEIIKMRKVIDQTCDSFERVRELLNAVGLKYEYELEAEFTYDFRRNGMNGHAYEPIVAGGANACTLHYCKNAMELPENGLVLIDIGAEYQGYCADITRTFAVGEPSEREVAVHSAVEKAHKEIINIIKPGLKFKDYQERVDGIMKKALDSLGLLSKPDDYRKYFPHAVSHGLGIDVHESLGGYGEFKSGMVLTVEPGIYVPEEGIGVRIEDNILVTDTGHENLSANLSTSL